MTGASKPNLIRILEILQPYRVYAEGLKAFVESKYCTDHSAEHVMGFIFQHVKQLKAERKAKKKNALQAKAQQKTDADVEQAEGLLKNMLGNEVLEQEAKDGEEDKDTKQNKNEKKVQSYLKQFDLKDIEDLASQDKDFLVQLGFSLDNGIDELHEKEFINGLKEYCKSFDLQNLNAQKIQLLTMVINAEYGECFDADPQKLNPVDLFWIRSVFFVYHGDWGEIMSLNYQSMKQVYQRYVKSKGGVGELDIGRLERIFRKEECKYFDVHTLDEIQLHQIVKVLNDEHGEHYDAANLSSDDKIWIKSVLLTYQGSRAVAMDKNYAELKQQFYTYLGLIGNSDNPEAEGVKMNLMYFLLGNKLNGWGISQDQIRETMQRQIEYTEYLNNAESIFRGVTIEKQQQIFNTLAEVTRTITLRKMHLNGIWIGAGEEYENTIKSMGYDHFNMVRACINDNASAGDILKSFHKPLVEIGCKYYLERVKLGKNIQGSIDEKNNDIQNLLNQIDRNYKEIVKSLQIDEENITPDQLFDATMSMNDEIYDKQKYIDNQKQRMDSDMLGYLRRQAALVKLEKGKYSFEHLQILLEVAKVTTPEAIRNTVGFDSREYISAQIREELQGAMEKYNPQSAEYLIFKMAVQGLLVLDNDKSQEIISNTLQEEGHNLNVVRQLIALESMGQDDKDSRKEFRGVEMLTTDRKKTRGSQQKRQEELMYSMKQETVKATMQLPVDMISGSSVDGIGVENNALDNTVNNYDDENVPRIVQIPGLGRMLLDVESVRLLESYGAYGDNAHFIQDGEQLVILGPVEKKSDYFADKYQVGREPVYKLSKKNICIAHADGSKIQLYNFDHTQTVTTLTTKSIGAYHMEQALMYQIEHHPFVHYMQDQLMPYINNNFGVAFRLLAEYAQEGRKPTRYIYEQIINDILGFKKYIPELKKYLSSLERTKLIGSLKEFGGKDNFDNPALANIVQMSNSMEDMVRLFDNENGGNAFMTFLDQKAFDFDGFDGWGQDVRQWLYDNGTVILITIAVATLFATGLGAPMGAMLGGGALATMGGSAIAGALGGMIGQRLGQFVDATVKNEIAAVQFGGEVGYVNPIDLEMFLSNDGLRKADGTKMGGWEFVGNLTQEFLGSAVQTFAFMGAGRIIGSSKQYLNLSKYIDDMPPTFTMNFGRLGVRTFGSQPLKDFLLKATRLHQMPPLPTEIENDILKGFVKEFVGELKEEGIGIGIEKGTEGTVFSPLGDSANIYFSISPTGNPDITLKNISSPEDGKTQKITFEYESADPYKKTLLIQQFKANKFEQQKDGALIFTKTKDGKTTQVEYIQTNESIEQRGNKELMTFFSGKDKDGKQLRKPIVRNPEGYYEGDFEYETTGTKGGLREVLGKVGMVKDNDLGYTVITKSGREIQVRMKKDDNQIAVEPEKKAGGGGGEEEESEDEENDNQKDVDNEQKSEEGDKEKGENSKVESSGNNISEDNTTESEYSSNRSQSPFFENMTNIVGPSMTGLDLGDIIIAPQEGSTNSIEADDIFIPEIGTVCRFTGESQIDDIIFTGYVRPNPNSHKMNKRRAQGTPTRVNRSLIDAGSGYHSGQGYILQTNQNAVWDGRTDAVSIDELDAIWAFNNTTKKWENIIEDVRKKYQLQSSNGSSQFQTDPIDGSTEQLPPITPEAEKNATQDELVTMNQQLESELSKGDLPEGSDSSFSQKLSSLLVSVTAKLKSGKIFTENITKTIYLLQDIFHRSPDRIRRNMLSNEAQEFCQTVLKVSIHINLPVELKYFIQSVYLSIISKNGEVRGAGEYMIRGGATVQHHYENKLSAATDSHIPKDDAGNPVYIMRDGSDIDIVKAKIGFVGAMEFMSSLFVGVPHLLKTPYFFGSDMKLPGDLDIDINSQDVFGDGGILERLQGDERVQGLKFIDKSTGKEVSGSINELIKNEEFMAQFETGGISIDFMIETDGVMVPVELFCNSADNKYSILGQGSNEKPILVLDNGLQVPSPELYVPYIEHITHKAIDQVDGSKPMDSKLVKRIWDYLETLQTVHVNSIASGETISITGYKIRQKILILFQKVVNKFGRGGLDDADATGDLAEKVVDVFGVNKDLLGNIVSDYKYIQNNLTPSPLPLPELQNRRIMIADIRANIAQSKQSNTPLDASIKQRIEDLTRYDFTDTAVGFAYYADYRILMNMDLSGVELVVHNNQGSEQYDFSNQYKYGDYRRPLPDVDLTIAYEKMSNKDDAMLDLYKPNANESQGVVITSKQDMKTVAGPLLLGACEMAYDKNIVTYGSDYRAGLGSGYIEIKLDKLSAENKEIIKSLMDNKSYNIGYADSSEHMLNYGDTGVPFVRVSFPSASTSLQLQQQSLEFMSQLKYQDYIPKTFDLNDEDSNGELVNMLVSSYLMDPDDGDAINELFAQLISAKQLIVLDDGTVYIYPYEYERVTGKKLSDYNPNPNLYYFSNKESRFAFTEQEARTNSARMDEASGKSPDNQKQLTTEEIAQAKVEAKKNIIETIRSKLAGKGISVPNDFDIDQELFEDILEIHNKEYPLERGGESVTPVLGEHSDYQISQKARDLAAAFDEYIARLGADSELGKFVKENATKMRRILLEGGYCGIITITTSFLSRKTKANQDGIVDKELERKVHNSILNNPVDIVSFLVENNIDPRTEEGMHIVTYIFQQNDISTTNQETGTNKVEEIVQGINESLNVPTDLLESKSYIGLLYGPDKIDKTLFSQMSSKDQENIIKYLYLKSALMNEMKKLSLLEESLEEKVFELTKNNQEVDSETKSQREDVRQRISGLNSQILEGRRTYYQELEIFESLDFNMVGKGGFGKVGRLKNHPNILCKISNISGPFLTKGVEEDIASAEKLVSVAHIINNPMIALPFLVVPVGINESGETVCAQFMYDVIDYLPNNLPDLNDHDAAQKLYNDLEELRANEIFVDLHGANFKKTAKGRSILDLNTFGLIYDPNILNGERVLDFNPEETLDSRQIVLAITGINIGDSSTIQQVSPRETDKPQYFDGKESKFGFTEQEAIMNSTLIDKAKKTPGESETPLTKEEIEVRNTIKKEILKTFEKKGIILPEGFEIDDQFLDAIIEAHNYNPNQEELGGFSPEVITKKALILKQYIDNYNKEIDEYNKSNLDNPKKKLDGSVIRCLMEGGYCGAVEPNEFINYIYHGLKIGDKIYTKGTGTIRTVLSIDKGVVTCEVNRNGFMTIEQLEKRRLANDVHLIEKIESAPNVAMNAMIENQTQSQINFNNYFEGNIAQGDISNCFQVATMRGFLNAASKNPRIKQLITDNLKELDDKRQVRIPIGSGPWIDVIKEDFKRKNNGIVGLFKKFGIDRIDQIDGPIGYKILETAIIKSLNSQIVGRLQTGRIGESGRALVNRGASPTIILETLFPTAFIKKLGAYDERPLSQVDYGAAYQLLTNFDPYNDIMTLGSLVGGSDSESYYVNGVKIYRSHAYTVVSVVNNMVTLENPMDTRTKIQLPLHDVINNFIGIRSITIP